jgi:hypothetical protein
MNLGFLWHDGSIDHLSRAADELYVAAFLAGFDKTGRFKATLDLAERSGLKPPQPLPRWYGLEAVGLLVAFRSAVHSLL